jgi:shikimate kinase
MKKRMTNIILIGMMGSGKYTISHLLQDDLKLEVVDTDALIEKQSQMSIAQMFELKGERYFRRLESEFLKSFHKKSVILSTGGGMIINNHNRKRLKEIGRVFYLKGSEETLFKRLKDKTSDRPLLELSQLKSQIHDLLLKRNDWYEETADYIIDINHKTAEEVVEDILNILNENDYKFSK